MRKRLTVTIDNEIYHWLYRVIGRGNISHFIERLIPPHVAPMTLATAYRSMADDEARESEALEWSENMIEDLWHEAS